MRISIALAACTAALCIIAGCGDEDCDPCTPCAPAVSDRPLAQMHAALGGGTTSAVSDTLRISFVSSYADTLFTMRITEADEDTVRIIDAGIYHPFTAAATRLSDGVNDQWTLSVHFIPGTTGVGTGTFESSWLNGGFTGEYIPDLHDAKITRIWLFLNEVSIRQASGNTNFDVDLRIVLMGTP